MVEGDHETIGCKIGRQAHAIDLAHGAMLTAGQAAPQMAPRIAPVGAAHQPHVGGGIDRVV